MSDGQQLADRVRRELAAHTEDDVLARSHALKDRFPHIRTYPSIRRLMDKRGTLLADVNGKNVLDLGCGNGERSLHLLKNGATVTGIDISPNYIETARAQAQEAEFGSDRYSFQQMDAHNLQYGDGSFDLVVGDGILHHLDLEKSVDEIHRVLVPGGRALFVEPLAANPLLRIFRILTPSARTVDEHPFEATDLNNFAADSRWRVESTYCGLVEAPVAVATSLLFRNNPENFLLRAADRLERIASKRNILNQMHQYVLLNLVKV